MRQFAGYRYSSRKVCVGKEKTDLVNSSEVSASLRDLIVHLHRGNGGQAGVLVDDLAGRLNGIMLSGMDPQSFLMQRAQQTMFAIDEVRGLLSERDFNAAVDAARDAEKEWKQMPAPEPGK
jgi:hypothetical protein